MNLETRIQLLSTLRFAHFGMGTRTLEINFDVFVIKSQFVIRNPYNKSSYLIFTPPRTGTEDSHHSLCWECRHTPYMEHDKENREAKVRKIGHSSNTQPQETAFPAESHEARNAIKAKSLRLHDYGQLVHENHTSTVQRSEHRKIHFPRKIVTL